MDYIMYFKALSSNKERLRESDCTRFKHILTDKQDQLKRSEVSTLKALMATFSKVYWDSDATIDDELLHTLLLSLKKKKQLSLIPELVQLSGFYHKYILWAKEMLDKYPPETQKSLEISAIHWTTNIDYTLACNEEIAYRKRKELICIDDFRRPCQLEDLLCFKAWLDMVVKTSSNCLFYNG